MIDLMFDFTVKATLLCLAAAILTITMRRASAASRHLVWTGLFIAVLALPIARVLLPTLPVFVLAAPALPRETPQPVQVRASAPAPVALPITTVDVSSPVPLSNAPAAGPISRAPITVGDVVPGLWLAGFIVLLGRVAIGRSRVRRLDQRASPLTDAGVLARVGELRQRFGVRRSVAVRVSADDWMPMTWGVARPVILLPAGALAPTAEARRVLDAMLIHEVAHIARFDAASQAIARFVVAAGWFHPLLWLAARQARLERERACDDAVLTCGSKPSEYASQLLALVETTLPTAGASHTLAMARRSQLEQRVQSILNARTNRRSASRLSRWIAASLVVAAVPGAAVQLAARTPAPGLTNDSGNRFPESIPGIVLDTATAIAPVPRRAPTVIPTAVQTPVVQAAPVATPQPGAPTYVIGTNDLLTVTVWRVPDLSGDVRVEPDGKIRLARGNPIAAAGWTADGLREAITAELKRCCLPAPDVFVQIKLINRGHSFFFFNAPPPPGQTMQSLTGVARDNEWDFMVKTLRDRAAKAGLDLATMIEIGTAVPIDRSEFQRVKQALDALAPWSHTPTPAELFGLRARFTEATRNLDAVQIRFNNGMMTIRELADAFIAVATALKEPPPDQLTWVPLPDADLLTALRNAAVLQPDSARANRLLDLAQRYAFTPEMVTLYVAAANGIGSDTERARVFAQQIRVKGK
jgi:beta-lactamase regulating signal transducer with metallopeptidase domain